MEAVVTDYEKSYVPPTQTSYPNFYAIPTKYTTKYASLSNGETIGYRESGEGESLIMLHGNFTCSLVMESLMSKLDKQMKCIAPCIRGFGYSSYVNDINTFRDLAQDIKLFLDEIKVDKFYIIGH